MYHATRTALLVSESRMRSEHDIARRERRARRPADDDTTPKPVVRESRFAALRRFVRHGRSADAWT